MTTVVICGEAPLPPDLHHIIEQGSTKLIERHADEIGGAPEVAADRIVFWSAADEPALIRLAEEYARRERRDRTERLMFVASSGVPVRGNLPPDDVFVWPQDEDRLKMAFLTGA